MAHPPLVAGNWKMNGLGGSIGELEKIIAGARSLAPSVAKPEIMVCPPATLIASFAKAAKGTPVVIGGQDCHPQASGAHTGDISAEMLRDAGAQAVIVGHSERRRDHDETDTLVRAKATAAHRAGLLAIVCIGETREDRELGQTRHVVARQLDGSLPDAVAHTVVAYEPDLGYRHRKDTDPERKLATFMTSFAPGCACASAKPVKTCVSSMVARLNLRTPRHSSRSKMSTALWSAAPASMPPNSLQSLVFTDDGAFSPLARNGRRRQDRAIEMPSRIV